MRKGTRGRWAVLAVAVCLAGSAPAAGSPPPSTPEALLPDLVPLPPVEVVGPSTQVLGGFGADVVAVDGCYPDERVRKGARRCLRFDAIVGNVGEGAFELAYHPRTTKVAAVQRVFNRDGSYVDRFAVRSELHPTHAHFHVQDFYLARLWRSNSAGQLLGSEPVARGDKNGFCPEDTETIGGEPARGTYSCFTPDEPDGDRGFQVVGISAGWMDVYPAGLPDQFVEITGVPDGDYVFELELDPHDVFREADDTNNKVCVHVVLEGSEARIVTSRVSC
jgi:hypothetical protein